MDHVPDVAAVDRLYLGSLMAVASKENWRAVHDLPAGGVNAYGSPVRIGQVVVSGVPELRNAVVEGVLCAFELGYSAQDPKRRYHRRA